MLLVTFLIPVSAILLGVIILQERLAPQHVTGMTLIFVGLAIIDGRLIKTLFKRKPTASRGLGV